MKGKEMFKIFEETGNPEDVVIACMVEFVRERIEKKIADGTYNPKQLEEVVQYAIEDYRQLHDRKIKSDKISYYVSKVQKIIEEDGEKLPTQINLIKDAEKLEEEKRRIGIDESGESDTGIMDPLAKGRKFPPLEKRRKKPLKSLPMQQLWK